MPADSAVGEQATPGDLEEISLAHLGKPLGGLSREELFRTFGLALRPSLARRRLETERRYAARGAKRVYYLSMEFLVGQSLRNNLLSLGLHEAWDEVARGLGFALDEVADAEPDAALGNGGLGRLAACFLDSLASLAMPGFGYGINYEYGLFRQAIDRGEQVERADHWSSDESPWMTARPDETCVVPLYGRVTPETTAAGEAHSAWLDWEVLVGVPHDMPIVGYGGTTVNYLRLYSARAAKDFDVRVFNEGDYVRAIEDKIASERVSKVLYPSDAVAAGRELRLVQEYFLVACAVRDILRRFLETGAALAELPARVALQMNDTHPALAVAELMRTLLDEHDLPWDEAWRITHEVCGYTNHTLMPEALERWPVHMLERVLPRHLQIVYEINHRFLERVRAWRPGDEAAVRAMSLIEEGPERQVRMANLAVVGSHSVNGVAGLHSRLVETRLLPEFHALEPGKFSNKTNGATPRRWLMYANPGLGALLSESIGEGWRRDLGALRALERFAPDPAFRRRFAEVKAGNKERLAALSARTTGVELPLDFAFDVQVKRIHEYKRQLLNLLGVIDMYLSLVEDGRSLPHPVACILAGKAAPGYFLAKRIIRLANAVAERVNRDPVASRQLRVVFIPDYKVSLAERIIPAAEISEQISTAGTEASGTSNMKFAMNGALTLGTLDGATIEMAEEIGAENMYIFGLTAAQVQELADAGTYDPWRYLERSPPLRRAVESLAGDTFCPDEPGLFRPLHDRLTREGDPYLHLADFASYAEARGRMLADYRDRDRWIGKAVLNVARSGKFSSDRTIHEYAAGIWGVESVP